MNKPKIFLAAARTGFAMFFFRAISFLKSHSESHPKVFFSAMVLTMAFSALVSFTELRQPPSAKGMINIAETAPGLKLPAGPAALLEVVALQAELKTFLDKKTPDAQDSSRMEEILERIQQLHSKLKRP